MEIILNTSVNTLRRLVLVAVLLVTAARLSAQDDVEMADYYYNQGQFEQAKLYYDKVYKTNKTNKIYTNYLNTLIALNEFEEAERMVKKKIKSENEDGTAYVQLGELYKRFNKPEEAKQEFENALRKTQPTRSNIVRLANEFNRINEFDYALRAYEKGKANSQDGYTFTYEIATTQGNLGNLEGMTESFLDLIVESSAYIQTVQNSLSRLLNFEENPAQMEMLKSKLLKRVQKSPEQTTYSEMLIWLFMQKKDFASALVQATALDKRLSEGGSRVMNLAELASTNKDYATAIKAYQYVIDKGPANNFYITARLEKLQVMNAELNDHSGVDVAAYTSLERDYKMALSELGKRAETAMMMKELAHVQAFYLDKADTAAIILREAIALPGLYPKSQAICKLELGDVSVFQGEIWDASLLYSQVELDFKEDPIGAEAKFRNARVSYFNGDFEWAQGQLDALKASTSKLISNDAIDLSLLIMDNFNMDTTQIPMKMFARADLLKFQNKFPQALATLDSIMTGYPDHSLADEILMMKADIALRNGKNDEAYALFERVLAEHTSDITADDALYKMAEMQEKTYMNESKAMELYERLLTEYPGSLYVVEARKNFRRLRGDVLN